MKLRKTIIGAVLLSSVFALVACKGKKTTKKNTITNRTTIFPTAPKTTTTEKNYDQYKVNKETYDSYFNPTINQMLAFNMTLTEKTTFGSNIFNTKFYISDGLMLIDSDSDDMFCEFRKNDDNSLTMSEHSFHDDAWNFVTNETYTRDSARMYFYGPYFDYSKLAFDSSKLAYTSSEVVKMNMYGSDFEYSKFNVKFDNNILTSLSYHSEQTMYRSNGDIDGVYVRDIKVTVSNIGITEVINPLYRVSKETFDLYFNPTVDQLLSLSYVANNTVTMENGYVSSHDYPVSYGVEIQSGYYSVATKKTDDTITVVNYADYIPEENTARYYNTVDMSLFDMIKEYYLMPFSDFSQFTFDETINAYVASQFETADEMRYTNIKIYFKDNKLKAYTFDCYGTSYVRTFTGVGTTTIPEVTIIG